MTSSCAFYRYSTKERAQIGSYTSEHGVAAAAESFSRKLGVQLSEMTVDEYIRKGKTITTDW